MEGREGSSSSSSRASSAAHLRPSITLPPRSSMESLFAGVGPGAASPGPMTLVSNFFSENDPDSDCRSFSQLLSGAMSSPVPMPGRSSRPSYPVVGEVSGKDYTKQSSENNNGGGDVDFQLEQSRSAAGLVGRPAGLMVTQPSMFTIPPGLSPTSLFDSPGFFPSTQAYGISHQQALAQVTAQAAQAQPQMHIQAEYPSFSAASTAPLPPTRSFASNATKHQQMPPPMPDSNIMNESSDLSNSDQRYQPSSVAVDKPVDDGYNWRKYGQKQVKGSEYPRSYYKCTHPNCPVKKKVERSLEGQVTEIIYKGQHNHQPPQSKRGKDAGNPNGSSNLQGQSERGLESQSGNMNKSREGMPAYSLSLKDQESSQATHLSESSDGEEVGDAETRVDVRNEDEPEAKRRNTEVRAVDPTSSHRTVTEPRIIVQTTSEVDLLDDGYRWRKYGQKVVKGNPYPRSYYKCTSAGCNVRKHVERAASDPKAVITTYEGKHSHDVPAAKNSSHNLANSTASQLKPHYPLADRQALVTRTEIGHNDQQQQPIGLRFKEEHIS